MNVGVAATHEVEPTADGLRAARHLVIESLRRWSIDERTANAALDVANELMSNAVQHGLPPIAVHIDFDHAAGAVTVVVSDGSPTRAQPLPYRAGLSERGLGLRIVAQLSSSWGQRTDADGKSVWATMHSARNRPPAWDR